MAENTSDDIVLVQAHGLRWRAEADAVDLVRKLDIARVRDPDSLCGGELVKRSTVRTVAHFGDLYVKHFRYKSLRRRLLHLVRATQAATEWRMGRALRGAGVPTCHVLAVAERREGALHREAFLISREIPNAVTLYEYLASPAWGEATRTHRQCLIEELADLVAGILRAGLHHRDLHAGNILIDPSLPAGKRLFVLDLHSVRSGRWGLLRMLVFLTASTHKPAVTAAERVRFLRAMMARCFDTRPQTLRRWAEKVGCALQRHRRRHLRSRARRCTLASTQFTPDSSPLFRVLRCREFGLEQAMEAVALHNEAREGNGTVGTVRKRGRRTDVTICKLSGGRTVCVKAYLRGPIRERIKDFWRPHGRARSAWIAHHGLLVRGIPAARGLALLEARRVLSGRSDYLIVEALPAQANVSELSGHHEPVLPQPLPAQVRAITAGVAELFVRLAEGRARHPDMKPGNILVAQEGNTARLWLVDLDRVQFDWEWTSEDWVHHLAQCNAGLGVRVGLLTRMRCLRACGRGLWNAPFRLRLARAVQRESLGRGLSWLNRGGAEQI